MTIFLAPVPIIHVHAMLEDMNLGRQSFAFGSSSIELFEKHVPNNCEGHDIQAYIYVTSTGESQLEKGTDRQLGILIQGRLCGWTFGDNRGQYPKNGLAHRPSSAAMNDGPMTLFWEIDNVKRLSERLPISDFLAANAKPFSDSFIPQGPMLIHRK